MLPPTGQPRRYRNGLVNIDSFLADHDDEWKRLTDLTRRARKPRSMSSSDLDDLVSLYQRTSTDLSVARSNFNDPALTARLTRLVADANAVIYGTRPRTVRALRRFFTVSFPAAVWHDRWFVVVAAALTFLPAIAVGTWLAHSPKAVEATAPAAVREAYVNNDFESYYSSEPAAQFASEVFVNNVQVAIYRVRRRHPPVRRHRLHPRDERGERRCRSGPVRGRWSVPQVLGADPPPRPARAVGRRHRRGCGAAPRLGDHRSRGSEPPRRASPSKDAGRS